MSVLRYPGGKTRAAKIIVPLLENHKEIVSPFMGGGSIELIMSRLGHKVYCGDIFKPLCEFWNACIFHRDDLIKEIRSLYPMSKDNFKSLQIIIDDLNGISMGAAFFALNRSSFSGTGMCGGMSTGAPRFNIASINRLSDLIIGDGIASVDCVDYAHTISKSGFCFADPPYMISNFLYGNKGDIHKFFDHKQFAEDIKSRGDFLITYNDCEEIRDSFNGCHIRSVKWSYGMNTSKKSSEILISDLPIPNLSYWE